MPTAVRAPHFVRSFERGLAVIRAFDADHPARTLSEVARASELPRAAARRLLLTLLDLGYVHCDGRLFRLTPRVLELGHAYLAGSGLPEIAAPHLEQLARTAGESAFLSVLDGPDAVCVAAAPAHRVLAAALPVGSRRPARETAAGRVLLAHLAPQRQELPGAVPEPVGHGREYAVVERELEDGLGSVAVPLRGADGAVVASVCVAAHAGRVPPAALRGELLGPVRSAAARIEADLRLAAGRGGRPGGSGAVFTEAT
ncbi:helix-turn-helix domain-containing protein [Streptomyces sp. NPDC090306]|uniref:IclR family transcriptional regulator domain-containing protein n=1 Tax=Streptomyces sp. NPDC090306 TaxID=3365961 RepID=UPI003825346B